MPVALSHTNQGWFVSFPVLAGLTVRPVVVDSLVQLLCSAFVKWGTDSDTAPICYLIGEGIPESGDI
jgi:hypothetical protein